MKATECRSHGPQNAGCLNQISQKIRTSPRKLTWCLFNLGHRSMYWVLTLAECVPLVDVEWKYIFPYNFPFSNSPVVGWSEIIDIFFYCCSIPFICFTHIVFLFQYVTKNKIAQPQKMLPSILVAWENIGERQEEEAGTIRGSSTILYREQLQGICGTVNRSISSDKRPKDNK